MRRVFVCSPLRGRTADDRHNNERYAESAGLDCVKRGECPYIPHLYLTRFLDDADPEQRAAGMATGKEWLRVADALVVYMNRGQSEGMQAEIAYARLIGIPVESRYLAGWS